MEFLGSFKKLPQGWYRLTLIGWIFIPIISALIFEEIFVNVLSEAIFLCLVLYYPLIRIILWVRDGFKNYPLNDKVKPEITIDVSDNELQFEKHSLENKVEPDIFMNGSDSRVEHYSQDKKPKPEISVGKNSFLYPEDGLGKMESGTVDNNKIKES